MRRLLIPVFLSFAGIVQAVPATSTLVSQRQAALKAAGEQFTRLPALCRGNGGESHLEIIAFPSGRADRIYMLTDTARAYRIHGQDIQLLWCGNIFTNPHAVGTSNVEKALIVPLKTVMGQLPKEGALDIY